MKGIELAREYYKTYGEPMIAEYFADYADRIAVGIVGQGSECFGFDDNISRDHDYEPGFCIWLTEKDEEKIGFQLMRKYSKLPREFDGVKLAHHSLFGKKKFGVFTIGEFYEGIIGMSTPPDTWQKWLYTPEHYLACATNGEIFRDDLGKFSNFRDILLGHMPLDVKKKKIAARLVFMAQSGQYNYSRCVGHGELASAQLAIAEFVTHTTNLFFTFADRYAPFYKWGLRALRQMTHTTELAYDLEYLLLSDNSASAFRQKKEVIDKIAVMAKDVLKKKGFTTSDDNYLETQALEVMDTIEDRNIKSLHIMEGV